MRYHLETGKRCKEFIILFIIAKDYFSFPVFASASNNERKGFQCPRSVLQDVYDRGGGSAQAFFVIPKKNKSIKITDPKTQILCAI